VHLALDTRALWNSFCVVILSVVCHGRAIPLLCQTLEHPSASISAEAVIALLQREDRLLSGFDAITVRAPPSGEQLGWFEGKTRWHQDHVTAAPMGCELRRHRLPQAVAVGSGHAALGVRPPGQSGSGQTRAHHSR
jgi:hypothetical protein